MHWQNRNSMRERDHKISLMPMQPELKPMSIRTIIAWIAFTAVCWIAFTLAVAAFSSTR